MGIVEPMTNNRGGHFKWASVSNF
jgi:hypothetical protein